MRRPSLRVGHISLAPSDGWPIDDLSELIAALRHHGLAQHLLTADETLWRRVESFEGVVVGPIAHSPLSAYSLVPSVDVVHVHDLTAAQAGLLLALTRSIPFVLTHTTLAGRRGDPLRRAIYRRAATVICRDDAEMAILRHFDPTLRIAVVPAPVGNHVADVLLRVYQNSQRMPIAGSSGSQ